MLKTFTEKKLRGRSVVPARLRKSGRVTHCQALWVVHLRKQVAQTLNLKERLLPRR